jgi:hypothetical protein
LAPFRLLSARREVVVLLASRNRFQKKLTREKFGLTNVPQIQLEVRAAYGSQVGENAVFLFELTCRAVAASVAASFRSWIAVSIQIDSEGKRLLAVLFFQQVFAKGH